MKTIRIALASISYILAVSQSLVKAQVVPSDYYINFAVPSVSAFSLLGTKPDQIARPGNLREFSAELQSLYTSGGRIPNGLAVEWTPGLTIPTKSKTLKEFKKERWWRSLTATLGTLQDTSRAWLGLGLTWTVFDKGDPHFDDIFRADLKTWLNDNNAGPNETVAYVTKIQNLLKENNFASPNDMNIANWLTSTYSAKDNLSMPSRLDDEEVPKANFEVAFKTHLDTSGLSQLATPELINELYKLYKTERLRRAPKLEAAKKYLDDLKSAYKKKNWNASALKIGVGLAGYSTDSTLDRLRLGRFASFASYAQRLGHHGQLLVQLQYSSNTGDFDPIRSSLSVGGRLLLGNANYRGLAEALYSQTNRRDLNEARSLRFTIGAEIRLASQVWIELATGATRDLPISDNFRMLLTSNLRYAFNTAARER